MNQTEKDWLVVWLETAFLFWMVLEIGNYMGWWDTTCMSGVWVCE